MKKQLIKILLLALIANPAQGMFRAMASVIKSYSPRIMNSAKRVSNGLPRGLPRMVIKNTQSFMPNSRFFSFKNGARISFKPQWKNIPWKSARIMPLASSLTAAALLAWPHKAYAQSQHNALEQSMPTASLWNYVAQGQKLSREAMVQSFIDDCTRHAHENNAIPTHTRNNDTVRVATYNVHMWKDARGIRNFDAIMHTIAHVNADVLVLQEVHMFDKDQIITRLQELGYTHASAGKTSTIGGTFFGNMVVSKYPFAAEPVVKTYDADQKYAGERRCYIKAAIQLPSDKKITVYGTHLDVYDQTETLRTQEIKELIADIQKNPGHCIIAADYNAVRKRDYQYAVNGKNVWDMLNENNKKRTGAATQTRALEILEQHHFVDSFTQNNQQSPKATVWSGTAVDFLYLNEAWNKPNAHFNVYNSSYVYYTSSSDHLPILMDMAIRK